MMIRNEGPGCMPQGYKVLVLKRKKEAHGEVVWMLTGGNRAVRKPSKVDTNEYRYVEYLSLGYSNG